MKRIIALLVVLLALTSCTQDIKFNNPSVQGLKDDVLWRASDSYGSLNGTNALTIVALNQFETLTLKTTSVNPHVCFKFIRQTIDVFTAISTPRIN